MMNVGINPVSFRSNNVQAVTQPAQEQPKVTENLFNDSVKSDVSKPVQHTTFKEKIANVWKFFSVTNKMVAASVKGLFYGAATGATFLAGSWLFKSLPKAFTKEGPKLWQTIRHPLAHISKKGKVIAGLAGTAVFAYNVIKGKFDANQNTAVIDHKLKTGHREV